MKSPHRYPTALRLGAVTLLAATALSSCGGSAAKIDSSATASSTTSTISTGTGAPAGTSQVLPIADNPINNAATANGLKITSVLVENNEDPATKKTVDDHLEIALENTSANDLTGFEVYYSFADPTDKTTEGYYTKLPTAFTIPAGGTRIVHFDNTGAVDHFPVNKYSLYSTSKNALDVKVTVSAADVAVQTATLKKDAGGAENAAE
jgi:hypothetical protein